MEVFKTVGSSPKGLSSDEAKVRLELYGYNEIKEERKLNEFLMLLSQFNSPLILILIISGIITSILERWVDSIIIFSVVLISASIGYIQERKAKKTIEALRMLIEAKTIALRDGEEHEISTKEIVPGDIILLEAGMKVPADAVLFSTNDLAVDESLLTGESLPVEKGVNGHVFAGTLIVRGYGKAVVVATGENTELGKIARSVRMEKNVETPLIKRIKHLSKVIFVIIVLVSILNFIIGIFRGYDQTFMFLASVSLAVAAIPESLPALITMTLAIGVRDMARKKAIVRRLPAVETLGSVTTICTDKTGTLTQNRMSVVKIFAGFREFDIDRATLEAGGNLELHLTIKAGHVCNKAIYRDGTESGDPTEIALLRVSHAMGIRDKFEVVDEIPFDPSRRFMATAVREGDEIKIYVKGSPENVLLMCRWALVDGKLREFDFHKMYRIASDYAEKGLRVLAFAYKSVELKDFSEIEPKNLIFLGFQCMVDPSRAECYLAIEKCRSAGVRVIMLTGDHPKTALFIARDLGIDGKVLGGDEVANMGDDELEAHLRDVNVFARVSPELKLRIVKLMRRMGETVSVTGDGVNDAPALKSADIGVAMGSGTDVAKESAEIILLDDNFATIVDAIEEGRNIFKKIQKILAWLLPTNLGEGLVVLMAFLLGMELPILPIQILWINTVTAILLGTTLVFEHKEPYLLKLKPMTGGLIDGRMLFRVIWVSIVLVLCAYALYFRYEDRIVARTVAMNTIVFFEIFYLLSSRSLDLSFVRTLKFRNDALYIGVLAMILLQILATYSPLNFYLHATSIDLTAWIEIIGASSVVFFLSEFEKYINNA